MTLPTNPIIVATLARYRNDTALQSLLGNPSHVSKSVFDEDGVPPAYPFPYVVVGVPVEQTGTALVMGTDGIDSYLQVSIFTQTGASGGMGQARGIAAQAYTLTHTKPLSLSGGLNNFFCLFRSQHPVPQPDGITQMIAQQYKLMTQG